MKPKSVSRPAVPASIERTPATPPAMPSEQEVRNYAYHLYQQSGCEPGHDLEHWRAATAYLTGRTSPPFPRLAPQAPAAAQAVVAHPRFRDIKALHGLKLAAKDGTIGHVEDFYFDDQTWAVRYLVANTGAWLTGRLVLITPHALGLPDFNARSLPVHLTRRQIQDCPPIDADKPVSRQYEIDYYGYYGWPVYWYGGDLWGASSFPAGGPASPAAIEAARQSHANDDAHLRSIQAITGYALQATDGEIGTVKGFLVDERTWFLGELIAETGHWYAGKEILIPTASVARISFEESKVYLNLTRAELKATREHGTAPVHEVGARTQPGK